ncbi:leucine-rich repeat domain-containing protein [Flammeovirga aprica]|uniref:Leucine-rich repeat domain-containing protein n=1 Tax=Flammeovirga aprica JL-4 TaxID=694437 RepID=A0A7X9S256_9BACT|nr:hypothetical protein [Flammeovirga aprica]NME72787.1 hypothetical protein [Flammeovirga aprica JL-4]
MDFDYSSYHNYFQNWSDKRKLRFLEKIFACGNFEFFSVTFNEKSNPKLISVLPENITNHTVQYIHIKAEECDLTEVFIFLPHLKGLSVEAKKIITGDLTKIPCLEELCLETEEWVDKHYLEKLEALKEVSFSMPNFELCINEIKNISCISLQSNVLNLAQLDLKEKEKLNHLSIHADTIHGIDKCVEYLNLSSLNITGDVGDKLPDIGSKLLNLKEVHLKLKNTKQLGFKTGSSLDTFTVDIPSSLEELKLNLFEVPAQEIIMTGDLKSTPQGKVQLHSRLENLSIQDESNKAITVPAMEGDNVKYLYLNIPKLVSFDNAFVHLPRLNHLKIDSFSSYMNLARFDNLEFLEVKQSYTSEESFDIEYGDNPQLKHIDIQDFKGIVRVNQLPANVKKVSYRSCYQMDDIYSHKEFPLLQHLSLTMYNTKKRGLQPKVLDMHPKYFPVLTSLYIDISESTINTITTSLALFENLYNIRLNYLVHGLNEPLASYPTYFIIQNDMKKSGNPNVMEDGVLLFSWMVKKKEDIIEDIPRVTDLFAYKSPKLHEFLNSHLKDLNPHQKALSDFSFEELKGKKILFLGKTGSTKTALKQDAKNIGLQPVTKIEQAELILIGKNSTFKSRPQEGVIYFSEKEFNVLTKEIAPKYLEGKDDQTPDFIENVRTMLLSGEKENELLALELIKNGGLPNELIVTMLFVGKCAKDAGVRTKFRKYLKGTLTDHEQKFFREKFSRYENLNSLATSQLTRHLSSDLLEDFFILFYKEYPNYWKAGLNILRENKEFRKKIILDKIDILIDSNGKRIKIYDSIQFFKDELELILKHCDPEKLKDIRVELLEGLPDSILSFYKLEAIDISGKITNQESFEDLICSLKNLTSLDISSIPVSTNFFKKIIYSLPKLKSITLKKCNFDKIPEEVGQLTDLVRLDVSGIKNIHICNAVYEHPTLRVVYAGDISSYDWPNEKEEIMKKSMDQANHMN